MPVLKGTHIFEDHLYIHITLGVDNCQMLVLNFENTLEKNSKTAKLSQIKLICQLKFSASLFRIKNKIK